MIQRLDRITAADQSRSGGKAYNCARLKQAGFPVPDGLVVPADASESDIAALGDDPWFDESGDESHSDARYAVRSSGIGEDSEDQSFAGIHETRLNVPRTKVAEAVRSCRASGQSDQAMAYRRAKGLPTSAIHIGVLVQRMVQPVAAGVAFTINPLTGAGDEIVVNSSWGVGEALVSGQVDPDEFGVRKRDGAILWERAGERAFSITRAQVQELATVVNRIERLYGAPQDIEWCHDGGQFWVVQSRPVTAASRRAVETEWTRANLAEVLPELMAPQPLAAFEDMLNRAERQYLDRLMAPEDTLGPMLKSFYGRLYFNLSQLRHICATTGSSTGAMLKSLGHAEQIDAADEKPARPSINGLLACAPTLVRIAWWHLRAAHVVGEHERRLTLYLERLTAMDFTALSDRDLWAVIDEWFRDAPESMQAVLLVAGVMFHEQPVRKGCERVGFPFERLLYPQLAAGERSVSAQQAFDLVALANTARREPQVRQYLATGTLDMASLRASLRGTRFLTEFDRFLTDYGHRGHYESDWSLPRYREDPTPLLRALRAHMEDETQADLSVTEARQAREAADAWAAFEQRLTAWQRWTMLPVVRRKVATIKQYYLWRERLRSGLVRILERLRMCHLVLADRFVERGWLKNRDEYFLLHLDEVAAVVHGRSAPDTLGTIAAARAAEQERVRPLDLPLLMRASELPRLIRTGVNHGAPEDGQLTGLPVSAGCVEAEVVVVRDPGDFSQMKRGAILVTRATDPSWTPLFTLASGVIVEIGGVLSHASTIAREYGLPALANVKLATRRLKTGDRVRLDATNGVVVRL